MLQTELRFFEAPFSYHLIDNVLQPLNRTEKRSSQMIDLYEKITSTIIEQLEKGTRPWIKPWTGENQTPFEIPRNISTGNHYRGINIPLLWIAAEAGQYASHEWASFKQWQAAKECVAKGEKGTMIIYYDTFEREQENGEIKKVPFIKASHVFNRCQLVSYDAASVQPPEQKPLVERIAAVDEFVANSKAVVEYRNGGACYVPAKDTIYMPHEQAFIDTEHSTATENFYSTLLHETSHWTGHPGRCNRKLEGRFGSNAYAFEELVAELSAAFLCGKLEISNAPRQDHASYLASWLTVLKEDKKAILTAASEASKVVDYLQTLQQPAPV
jgi:antirestriction protein ArdC